MHWLKRSRYLFRLNEPMSAHTSFRIGGPAQAWVCVRDFDELGEILESCRKNEMPYIMIGSGNNLLVRDGGVEGVVLHLEGKVFRRIRRVPGGLRVGAGVTLQKLVGVCMQLGLAGCEFLVAIPGTVGGAVYMNAGTRDTTVSERIVEVTVIDPDGQIRVLTRDEIDFGYRKSGLGDAMVLEAEFQLAAADRAEVRKRVLSNFMRKKRTQDLVTPSAGSIFKNASDGLVTSAKLIEMSGLKGVRLGGARVSPIHSNFIINEGHARAGDVESLIEMIQEKVLHDHGVGLELEVRVVGRK